jgi:cytoskeletal protein RodZ
MKHLGVIVFIIGLLIATLFFFKDELFFKEHKTISNPLHNQSNHLAETKPVNLPSKTNINKNTETNKQIVNKPTLIPKEKDKNIVINEIKANVKSVKKVDGNIEVELYKEGKVINAYMQYDDDLYVLLEDAKEYKLPLIFVIKKENDKVYIEEIK